MMKRRPVRKGEPAHVQTDSGIPFPAVPVAPVTVQLTEPDGKLIERGFDLLQTQHVGLFSIEKIVELRLTGADTVDVPGRDLERHWALSYGRNAYDKAHTRGRCGA